MKNNQQTFSEKAILFYNNLKKVPTLPPAVSFLNPYLSSEVSDSVEAFFRKFYNDKKKRIYIYGINPGRFGGGITGIPFTDPVALNDYCGIPNRFQNIKELSSVFIYSLVDHMGGVDKFFSKYYLTALFPLALICDKKNFNYYDDPQIYLQLKKYIIKNIIDQYKFGSDNTAAISLGKKNSFYLQQLNSELHLFNKIITLDHPRYIMQYKRKLLPEYIDSFRQQLSIL